MLKALIGFLCVCLPISAQAKVGETVPQLIKRFGKSYTLEEVELGKTYKFRSANVSVDVFVASGRSISETYFSDHPLTANGEPPNDIVRAVLKTNVPQARWLETDAAPFGADYALRSSDGEYLAILKYTGPQPENMIWTMTVGLAKSVQTVSATAPSSNPSPSPFVTSSPSAPTEYETAVRYFKGDGVEKNHAAATKWFRRAAEQNFAPAQRMLAACYYFGDGLTKNYGEAVRWSRKAAEQGDDNAQFALGLCFYFGQGVPKDFVEAYKWLLLATAQGNEDAEKRVPEMENQMTRQQIAEGQKLARDFQPLELPAAGADSSGAATVQARPISSGTGFFITDDGYLITNQHVAGKAAQVRLVMASGTIPAKIVNVDAANDLALLKAEGDIFDTISGGLKFKALPIEASRAVKLGSTVLTVGFPSIGLQGFAPKFARGEIASMTGPQDDPRFFQISVPLQPGNSGGALVNERGNVVGVVSAKLSAAAALKATGELPENVNYAVKSSFLLGFLESVPEVAAKLKEPNASDMKFEDVVEKAKRAAVLVLVDYPGAFNELGAERDSGR